MGVSTDAILAYGYDLGDPDEGWKATGLDWWDLDAVDEDGDPLDFREAAHDRLPKGVSVIRHCSAEAPMYILAAYSITSHRGWSGTVDLPELIDLQEDADARLSRALDALGITPTQPSPAWLLVSDWG